MNNPSNIFCQRIGVYKNIIFVLWISTLIMQEVGECTSDSFDTRNC